MVEVEEISIVEELDQFGVQADDEVVSRMKELCIVYRQNAEEIVSQWIAYSSTKGFEFEPSISLLDQFEQDELNKIKTPSSSQKSNKKARTPVTPLRKAHMTVNIIFYALASAKSAVLCFIAVIWNLICHISEEKIKRKTITPDNAKSITSLQISPLSSKNFTPPSKYCSRSMSRDVIISYRSDEYITWKTNNDHIYNVNYYDTESALTTKYPFMFEKLRDCAYFLNERIQNLACFYQNRHKIEEWSSMQSLVQEEVDIVGSIYCDGEGKLNSSSLLLQGSWELTSGLPVQLDVSCLSQFSFFPGQVIIYIIFIFVKQEEPLPFSSSPPSVLIAKKSLQIVVAAGPFTATTNEGALSYQPLSDVLNYVKEYKPHICILVGPFVDSKHEIIERGNFSITFEEIFNQQIEIMLESIKGINTKIVLIPSLRDIHHYAVYPTPPFNIKYKSEQLICMPDPCVMNIDGIVIGITSTDVLFHIGREEVTFPSTMSDRLGRLCRHILNQQSFYPLYPSNEVNISYEHLELYAKLTVSPHILILPSDLRHFIKDVNGCCCINPERLTKGLVGGTFARIQVMPIGEEEYESTNGSLISKIIAEIVKI
ncbi:DNA polymerase alpha subunit B-like [Centruroides sculpturatus]|uniref:DNA polymerase alpha subunit B-like n=1 Tax=Centruroides sculpturatus TaxID=218467 RepID=UPI000C6D4A50|nr:DNA polymerase alpha subunit B-like [Centruroides sculpturatus]